MRDPNAGSPAHGALRRGRWGTSAETLSFEHLRGKIAELPLPAFQVLRPKTSGLELASSYRQYWHGGEWTGRGKITIVITRIAPAILEPAPAKAGGDPWGGKDGSP